MKRIIERRRTRMLVGAAVAMTTALATGSVAQGQPDRPGEHVELHQAAAAVQRGQAWTQAMRASNFTVVGHSDLGGGGLNADVWVHRGYAYVGVWSGTCPASGVKVVDARRPSSPRLVSRLSNPRRTSAEDVVVRSVRTAAFTGDLAVVGIQTCDEDPQKSPAFRGLQFWDVTDPVRPRPLSQWRSALGGCHEVDMVNRGSRLLAACAEPFAEPRARADEVVLVDVTNPASPRKVSGFALKRDAGVDSANTPENVGCAKASFAHSVRFTDRGHTLYVSYWDVGTLRLDVSRTGARLRLVNRADVAPPDEDGDNHSMTLARGGSVQLVNLEDFSPEDPKCTRDGGWGEVHLLTATRGTPRHLATFSTPDSRSTRKDGFFSVHNTEVVKGTQAFSSWYTDGIVWWTLADPRHPRMHGQFVPPPTEDPQGVFPPVPIVWGVFPDRRSNLIFASDINSGLWILRPTGLGAF